MRVASSARRPTGAKAVERMLEESQYFIEWTAREAEIETAAELVELQIQLACWQRDWAVLWSDPVQRTQMAERSRLWSDRVLDLSGLLNS